MIATCSASDPATVCPTPVAGSNASTFLTAARSQARFAVLYPCQLPNDQRLVSSSVTGAPGRQLVELVFDGPFDLTLRQSQYAPPITSDPAGASRSTVDLAPNVRATLIETNDGSRRAQYHLLWEKDGMYYEVQAVGPPLQRRDVLRVATSLAESPEAFEAR